MDHDVTQGVGAEVHDFFNLNYVEVTLTLEILIYFLCHNGISKKKLRLVCFFLLFEQSLWSPTYGTVATQ